MILKEKQQNKKKKKKLLLMCVTKRLDFSFCIYSGLTGIHGVGG